MGFFGGGGWEGGKDRMRRKLPPVVNYELEEKKTGVQATVPKKTEEGRLGGWVYLSGTELGKETGLGKKKSTRKAGGFGGREF